MHKTVVIIGAGPAGLMAANELSKNKIDYCIIDKNPIIGKKLLITGGSRCNVTNIYGVKDFINNLTIPHNRFLYSTLSKFGTEETITFMNKRGVELYIDEEIKYFPKSDKSLDIVNALKQGVTGEVFLNESVQKLDKDGQFKITTNRRTITSDYVIVATGSKSFPKTGSTGDGITFAENFNHTIIPFYPAETNVHSKLIQQNKELLQGIIIKQSHVKIQGTKINYSGDLLFTHFGMSGPVIQHISEFVFKESQVKNVILEVSLTDKTEQQLVDLLEHSSDMFILKLLQGITIKRVAKFILEHLEIVNKKTIELSKKDKFKIINILLRFEVPITRTESLENAYINGGGVSTKELNPKTFESKRITGLYFIGETVDVHGPIGGYNITIAFSSGYSAANAITTMEKRQ